MFDLFSWSHILIVLIVALVVVGPKDLPRLMHMAGRWVGKARAMADQFRKSFDEMARQSELDELRKEIAALRSEKPLAELGETIMKPLSAPVGEIPAHNPDSPDAAAEEPPAPARNVS